MTWYGEGGAPCSREEANEYRQREAAKRCAEKPEPVRVRLKRVPCSGATVLRYETQNATLYCVDHGPEIEITIEPVPGDPVREAKLRVIQGALPQDITEDSEMSNSQIAERVLAALEEIK